MISDARRVPAEIDSDKDRETKSAVVQEDDPERVAWSTPPNLPTDEPELTCKIMRAAAAQNVRVDKPVYHLALASIQMTPFDRVTMERVADRVFAALKLEQHPIAS